MQSKIMARARRRMMDHSEVSDDLLGVMDTITSQLPVDLVIGSFSLGSAMVRLKRG